MDSSAGRRTELVYLVLVAAHFRAGPRPQRQWAESLLPGMCARLDCAWTGRLDPAWIASELNKVKAQPGDYSDESYERWRLLGLPAWAALAAGLTPTPGSLTFVGRRPSLP